MKATRPKKPYVSYIEKLRSPLWQQMRLKVLERDKWTCRKCFKKEKTLNVHHTYYEKGRDPWDYPAESLQTLCEDCHVETEALLTELRRLAGVCPWTLEGILDFTLANQSSMSLEWSNAGIERATDSMLSFLSDAQDFYARSAERDAAISRTPLDAGYVTACDRHATALSDFRESALKLIGDIYDAVRMAEGTSNESFFLASGAPEPSITESN